MDPNANLAEQRRIIARVLDEDHPIDTDQQHADLNRLAELARALDEWIHGGGFLPHPWAFGQARR